MRLLLPIACVVLAACDLQITNPAPVVATTTSPPSTTITNTNTNTSTNNNDRSDTAATPTTPGGTDGTGAAVPLPTYGETVVRGVADRNPDLLANSCQETAGETAWQFLDLVIRTLRAQDQRWGYLCKDQACLTFGRDVITYRATAADTGIFIVDIIGNHCPLPGETATVRYGVLPFETVRKWSATRKAGVF
jgi:hypothetical protein